MDVKICIVGLGYVGLPLAAAFARKSFTVIGYDINKDRIEELQNGVDRTDELSPEQLAQSPMHFSSDPSVISEADVIIVAIPTPVDEYNKPVLSLLESASETIGEHLKRGAVVVYESTVYPGVTEEICGPILEKMSNLTCGKDFYLGYSPERINPGDKVHTVDKIIKVVAGQDDKTTDMLCELYGSVVEAGIHRAPNIKVAEMAKAIENAQRDLNIAYVNEIAMLCNRIGITTTDVLEAAGTKWNFLPFKPGLVGGHCIGVDPYYLVEKARQLDMDTRVIAAGRVTNDGMAHFIASQVCEKLPINPAQAKILVLGLTFKENVPDMRNSKVRDVIQCLQSEGCHIEAHDPFLDESELHAIDLEPGNLGSGPYDAVLLLVPHQQYCDESSETYRNALTEQGVMYDLKSILPKDSFVDTNVVHLTL